MRVDGLQASTASLLLLATSIFTCSILNSHSYVIRLPNHRIDGAYLLPTTTTSIHHRRHQKSQLRLKNLADVETPIVYNHLPPPSILCMGEILWDSLPSGIYLGGAPSNVAVHLASLFQNSSSSSSLSSSSSSSFISNYHPTVAIAACLGNDQLGREARRRLSLKGVRTDFIQYHEIWETGMATATLNGDGDATYEFNTPAAWDGLQLEDKLMSMMQQKDDEESSSSPSYSSTKVIIMGTIAARLNGEHGSTSSSTLATIRSSATREGTAVVLDVNLRSPWYTPKSVLGLARGTGASPKLALLKLNEEELCILEQWCRLESEHSIDCESKGLVGSVLKQRMVRLGTSLNAERVCVTRGKDGAALLCMSGASNVNGSTLFHENPGYTSSRNTINNDCDSVGAGDAFLAALVSSLFLYNEPPERALERACALGAYVAGCRGATPEHGDAPEELRRIFSLKN